MSSEKIDDYFNRLTGIVADVRANTPGSPNVDFSDTNLLDIEHYNLDEAIYLHHKKISSSDEIKIQIRTTIKFIMYNFDAASQLNFLGDPYRFFLTFTQVINKTIGLLVVLRDGGSHWKNPKNPLLQMSNHFELNFISGMFPSIDDQIVNLQKRNYLDWCYDLLDELSEKYNQDEELSIFPEGLSLEDIVKFMDGIYLRDYLWNFRAVRGCKGVYRGPDPGKFYQETERLREFLTKNDIKLVIDLRGNRRSDKHADSGVEDYLKELEIDRVVLDFNEPTVQGDNDPGYVRKVKYLKDTVKAVMRRILKTEGSILFHCASGKDRTGVTATLLQMLMGYSEDEIIAEYIYSGHNTIGSRIEAVVEYIESSGGIDSYLESCGLSSEELEQLRKKIL